MAYENLAENPIQGLETIFKFYNLPIRHLLPGAYGYPAPNSIKDKILLFDKPMDWLNILSEKEIGNIQTICKEAMQLWGYNPILSLKNNQPNDFVQRHEKSLFLN